MINSLVSVSNNCKIYVLCMDSFTHNVLSTIYSENVCLISIDELLNDELKNIRLERSEGEFCWTCTAVLIRFILSEKKEQQCTYVDADLFFYKDPTVLIQEMVNHKCTVQVVPHWFGPSLIDRYREKESGRFCVQFNTFSNESRSMLLLDEWADSCLKKCSLENHGDQLYIHNWDRLDFVNVTENSGAGIAPWNIKRYYVTNGRIFDRLKKQPIDLIFYHFQDIEYLDRYHVYVKPFVQHRKVDKKLYYDIYIPYLIEIEKTKKYLEKLFSFVPQAGFRTKNEAASKKKISYFDRIKAKFKKPLIFMFNDFFQKIRKATRKKIINIDLTRYLNE